MKYINYIVIALLLSIPITIYAGTIKIDGVESENVNIIQFKGRSSSSVSPSSQARMYFDTDEMQMKLSKNGVAYGTFPSLNSNGDLTIIGDFTASGGAYITDNVGIGTNFPESKLEVVGDLSSSGDVTVCGTLHAPNAKEFAYLTLSGDQSSAIAATDEVAFQTNVSRNLSVSDTTHQVTLKNGQTYKLESSLRVTGTGNTMVMIYRWYDITNSLWLGTRGVVRAMTSTQNQNDQPVAMEVITPTSDIHVEVRIITSTATSTIYAVSSYAFIETIDP